MADRASEHEYKKDSVCGTYYGFPCHRSIVVHLQEQGPSLGIVPAINPSQADECTLWTKPRVCIIGPQTPEMSDPRLRILPCLHSHIKI